MDDKATDKLCYNSQMCHYFLLGAVAKGRSVGMGRVKEYVDQIGCRENVRKKREQKFELTSHILGPTKTDPLSPIKKFSIFELHII